MQPRVDCGRFALSIIPGPPPNGEDELSSESITDVAAIDPAAIAAALLEIPGVECATPGRAPDWHWEAVLHFDGGELRMRMTLVETDDAALWGGFTLAGVAPIEEIGRVADHLRARFSAIWIHDGECTMRSPAAFRAWAAGASAF